MLVRCLLLLFLCRSSLAKIETIDGTSTSATDFFGRFVSGNVPAVIPKQLTEMLQGFDMTASGLSKSGVAAISVVSTDGTSETTLMDFFRKPTNSFEIPIHRNLKTRIVFPAVLRCNPLLADLLFETLHTFADFDGAEHGGKDEEVGCFANYRSRLIAKLK